MHGIVCKKNIEAKYERINANDGINDNNIYFKEESQNLTFSSLFKKCYCYDSPYYAVALKINFVQIYIAKVHIPYNLRKIKISANN